MNSGRGGEGFVLTYPLILLTGQTERGRRLVTQHLSWSNLHLAVLLLLVLPILWAILTQAHSVEGLAMLL
jgi:hypothetical protein